MKTWRVQKSLQQLTCPCQSSGSVRKKASALGKVLFQQGVGCQATHTLYTGTMGTRGHLYHVIPQQCTNEPSSRPWLSGLFCGAWPKKTCTKQKPALQLCCHHGDYSKQTLNVTFKLFKIYFHLSKAPHTWISLNIFLQNCWATVEPPDSVEVRAVLLNNYAEHATHSSHCCFLGSARMGMGKAHRSISSECSQD